MELTQSVSNQYLTKRLEKYQKSITQILQNCNKITNIQLCNMLNFQKCAIKHKIIINQKETNKHVQIQDCYNGKHESSYKNKHQNVNRTQQQESLKTHQKSKSFNHSSSNRNRIRNFWSTINKLSSNISEQYHEIQTQINYRMEQQIQNQYQQQQQQLMGIKYLKVLKSVIESQTSQIDQQQQNQDIYQRNQNTKRGIKQIRTHKKIMNNDAQDQNRLYKKNKRMSKIIDAPKKLKKYKKINLFKHHPSYSHQSMESVSSVFTSEKPLYYQQLYS